MAYLTEDRISTIVERVVARMLAEGSVAAPLAAPPASPAAPPVVASSGSPKGERGVFTDLDAAVAAANAAYRRVHSLGLTKRYEIIAEMRRESREQVDAISRMAVEETGMGRVDQKIIKNRLVTEKTPGPEILEPWAETGDNGLTLEEWAPFGVLGAIAPSTNPTETIICNAIAMISAGNAVVFNAHPSARRVSAYTVQFLNDAIVRSGGPENLITCTSEPTIQSAQALMKHPGIRLLVVTGGPGVVKEAMNSGKKVIAAGPGNPPVVVDETADLDQAAEGIVLGVSLDNNIVCVAEKEIIAVASIADALKQALKKYGAYELNPAELAKMEKLVVEGDHPNKKWVGKDAALILREIGVQAPPGTLIAYAEVPEQHPFVQHEMLMPVTGLVRVPDFDQAVAAAVRCEHGFGHSASMYSKNIDHLHQMAVAINTSIFTKNAPTYAGLGYTGEGFTSFTIASPTGEGLTTARSFSRRRRCVIKDYFRIV